MEQINPFALVRASDYTDAQINSLWVDIGQKTINAIIEPRSRSSKFILGGKGTGKTHLLRYFSYPVVRLRSPRESGISILDKHKFLAIFHRATGDDAARFEAGSQAESKWQLLFGVYLELKLVEGVLDALCDIKDTSPASVFDDRAFIDELAKSITDNSVSNCQSLSEFRDWIIHIRRSIDEAVNNVAFTGILDLRIPFSVGSLCIPVSRAIVSWNKSLEGLPLIYLIDEIENFTKSQQQVINSLIRYGEGLATFRVTGRLYAIKTLSTIANGEENREGAEFRTTNLDDILRNYPKYPEFALKFVTRRLSFVDLAASSDQPSLTSFSPASCFEEIDSNDFYSNEIARFDLDKSEYGFVKKFIEAFSVLTTTKAPAVDLAKEIAAILTSGMPILVQKLNLLIYCKKHSKSSPAITLAKKIREDALNFISGQNGGKGAYKNAYNHYSSDLFAQLCRDSPKGFGVPYAGFDTFIKMSSGNPRNLLIILGRAFENAAFKEIDFIHGPKLSVAMQTEASLDAAKFMYESDSNYGRSSEQAREAVSRLALILRTARYALNIPESSPLAVSFSDTDLTPEAKASLESALNYSFVYEIGGRPDRNSQRVNRKIQLNPLLSPKWGLPIVVRGDIGLTKELVDVIFNPNRCNDFDSNLKVLDAKWNNPFKYIAPVNPQNDLF